MYYNVGSDLWIHLLFSSSLRRARALFRRYNSRTYSITKKPTNKCRQVHSKEYTNKQLFTFRYVLRQCTLLQVLIYEFTLFLAHLREGPEPIFGVITLVHILFQKRLLPLFHKKPTMSRLCLLKYSSILRRHSRDIVGILWNRGSTKTAGRYIQQSTHIKIYLHLQVCTQVMDSIVGSHLWIRFIFYLIFDQGRSPFSSL